MLRLGLSRVTKFQRVSGLQSKSTRPTVVHLWVQKVKHKARQMAIGAWNMEPVRFHGRLQTDLIGLVQVCCVGDLYCGYTRARAGDVLKPSSDHFDFRWCTSTQWWMSTWRGTSTSATAYPSKPLIGASFSLVSFRSWSNKNAMSGHCCTSLWSQLNVHISKIHAEVIAFTSSPSITCWCVHACVHTHPY